jgi:hypothetical protein
MKLTFIVYDTVPLVNPGAEPETSGSRLRAPAASLQATTRCR